MFSKKSKKIISFILALMLAASILPTGVSVHANPKRPAYNPTLDYFYYTRLSSLSSPTRTLAVHYMNQEEIGKIYSTMVQGETSFLQFAIPYNSNISLEVYHDKKGYLGTVYGSLYTKHVTGDYRGYTGKGDTLKQIVEDIKTSGYTKPEKFRGLNSFAGIGFFGTPLPTTMSLSLQETETETETEIEIETETEVETEITTEIETETESRTETESETFLRYAAVKPAAEIETKSQTETETKTETKTEIVVVKLFCNTYG